MQEWSVRFGETEHTVVYEGLRGKQARLVIDGAPVQLRPKTSQEKVQYYFYRFEDGEIVLQVKNKKTPAWLAVDGVFVDSGLPVDEDMLHLLRTGKTSLRQRDKDGMNAFATLILFSVVNIVLVLVRASARFVFSAAVPATILEFCQLRYYQTGQAGVYAAGIVIALALTGVYILIYQLAKKRDWPVAVAFALVLLDTLFVLMLLLVAPTDYILDTAYHAWVILAMARLLSTRRRMKREAAAEYGAPPVQYAAQPAPETPVPPPASETESERRYDVGEGI